MGYIVDNFLWCFQLETGGVFLGWLGIITHSLLISMFTMLCCFGPIFIPKMISDAELQMKSNEHIKNVSEIAKNTSEGQFIQIVLGFRASLLVLSAVVVYVILFLKLWSFVCLLNGTNKRDHKKVFIFVIIDAVFIVLSVFYLLFFYDPVGAIYQLFSIYLSVCIFSLYKTFEMQSKQKSGLGAQQELTTISTAAY